jgi:hypothetical protein
MKHFTHLSLSWSTSRGVDTYGYNIARLDDQNTGKRYRCMGGGYDMGGTVFANWLQDVYQAELRSIYNRAYAFVTRGVDRDAKYNRTKSESPDSALYGMTAYFIAFHAPNNLEKVSLDGGCGLSAMIAIADAIGLDVERTWNRKGHTTGFYVTSKESTNR